LPEFFALHDKYSKRGLIIIGVHVGRDDEVIDSTEKLDGLLKESRTQLWGGRDVPFPVAIVISARKEFPDGDQTGRTQTSVDYGVQRYPSQVLIDPEGRVLGWFNEKEHIKLFEKLPEAQ
jgi:hypothetical protein